MTGDPGNGLPDDWEALGRADAKALAPPADAKDRVRVEVALTLGLGAALGATTASTAASAASAASAGASQAPAAAQGALGSVLKALVLKKATLVTVAAVTAVAGGTATYVEVQSRREATAHRVAAEKQVASLTPAPAPQVVPEPVPAPTPAPAPAPVLDSLGEERVLLDQARSAIAAGRLGEAQTLLARHATVFPEGRLGEERQALQIRLLVRQGRVQEAKRRAALFRRQHPRSIQLPVIDEALRGHR